MPRGQKPNVCSQLTGYSMEQRPASEADNSNGAKGKAKVSPRITRPKLPFLPNKPAGHIHRAKTDPGEAAEIKSLVEEIKKLKEGTVFDKNPLRTKLVKPQTIGKARSTHTSPRTSPPLGSPNSGTRSSSLNRNRSRSLKLLTDKLKSGRGQGSGPRLRRDNSFEKSYSTDDSQGDTGVAEKTQEELNRDVSNLESKNGSGKQIPSGAEEQEMVIIGQSIPENEKGEEEEEVEQEEKKKKNHSLNSGGEDLTEQPDVYLKVPGFTRGSPGSLEDEGIGVSECESGLPPPPPPPPPPVSSSFTSTLHPIDMNSEFLRLRQMAPKRRPGYAGITLPSKSPTFQKCSQGDEKQEEQPQGRRLNRFELGALGSGQRKIGGMRFVTHPTQSKTTFPENGPMDTNGFGSFRSPSTESPPPLPGELEDKPSQSSLADSQIDPNEMLDKETYSDIVASVVAEGSGSDGDKQEKRNNGKSVKQKSKSDPSGNRSHDFSLHEVINSSQSHSFPLLSHEDKLKEDIEDKEVDLQVVEELDQSQTQSDLSQQQTSTTSFSEDPLSPLSPHSEPSDAFEDSCSDVMEISDIPRQGSVSMVGEEEGVREGEEGAIPVHYYSDTSTSTTPSTQSPSGTLERPQLLLSVPLPKRPIARSVSSASVLQRERNHSGGMNIDKDVVIRKHSITGLDDTSSDSFKTGELSPIRGADGMLAASMPAVWNMERCSSESPERDSSFVKDSRYHIVEELYKNEKEYVEALKMLKEKYMAPLKNLSSIDETVIDNIFYMIPEILTHHCIYLNFLNQVWSTWDNKTSSVGDIIAKTFSRQTVLDSYLSFVENYKTSGKVIENALQTKSSIQKFIEQCQKESGSKLTMKDLIVRPVQRIPRYELFLQRLLDHTPTDHPDYELLKEAEKVIHEFALKIGTANETQHEEGQQESLKKLELLLNTDLAVPDRAYLRHDMVQILSKKDQCCLWMFSDLIIISSVKRKSGPVTRKVSVILKSPTGQDFAENIKQKVWLRVGLDNIEIVKGQGSLTRRSTIDKEQVEEDLELLNQISELTNKLNCQHSGLEEVVKEMKASLKKQLSEHNLRSSLAESNKMELLVTTQEGIIHLEVSFSSGEKRAGWETGFTDAKQKLSMLSDKRAPEFLQALQITKTRAGMQFSCAAPIDGLNAKGYRDVWVCNSDGYVGHMCLLSLQPEPIVTLNTPVPGCNARILCICAVPANSSCFRRKSSTKRSQHRIIPSSPTQEKGPRISVEEVDAIIVEEYSKQSSTDIEGQDTLSEEGYQSDSTSSEDEDYSPPHKLFVDEYVVKRSPPSQYTQSSPDPITLTGSWTQDPHKGTMWLGTEDGCIHIFQCTDNIKTTKNKLKIQLGYPVYCIVYLDNKVFVSLSNGDIMVYRRDTEGVWDTEHPYTRTLGTVTAPISKMLPVAGKLWCGCQNNISVINPLSLNPQTTFQVHQDVNKSVQCIVTSGQGVWIASQQSSKVLLYHATTYEYLLEVSIANAVNQKLQSADDIIRQHKAACLRITALMVCKDLLWVGTSAGVILSIPMPRITSTTTRGTINTPTFTGLVYGHTGHVRFLTCVEMTSTPSLPNSNNKSDKEEEVEHVPIHDLHRRSSMATTTATLATRMLVISGGDGYEDFRNSSANESAGRDDSTNHLLLWQV
ncbi:hypothetical protein CHS0354_012562 [Potamilus streckersoni]|uniref:DH domain-containing protein n=1 Tax=Potamilus streckersoni TaxID=2493646 RepID=A0AAE0SYC9_9BIVA|nr:hypothetical protein CHS0354_012562 [Potamilus streckersoni]